jgi:ATP-dependent Lon protease
MPDDNDNAETTPPENESVDSHEEPESHDDGQDDGHDDGNDQPTIPDTLPVLPLRDVVPFPDAVLPLTVGRPKSVKLVDEVVLKDKIIALVAQRDPAMEDPEPKDLFRVGVAAAILKMVKFPDETTRILVQGIGRIEVPEIPTVEPYLVANVKPQPDIFEDSTEVRALVASVVSQFVQLVSLIPNTPEEMKVAAMNIQPPGRLADFIASHLNLKLEERQELLETVSVRARLEKLSSFLGRELEVAQIGQKIQNSVQERVEKGQREFFLREQLRAIRKELGEEESGPAEIAEFKEKIEKSGMTEEALKEAQKELTRLERMSPQSAEYSVIATYLDWLTALPWSASTEDNLDVTEVRKVLDADHWGLEKIKDRIVEYVAVRKLKPDGKGPIICFVGPPGVGKTSLGQSIARALGRKFVRMSLGGVRDEAEIRGHRRTYVGALPGKIIQAIRRSESHNPIMMLDEVDKLGADFRGDPSSALLEVLDPEQNSTFVDHYLGVSFDLSKVIFIVTANVLETIPPPLRDRLEIIQLAGYSEEEKTEIAVRHLIPRQLDAHGLKEERLDISKDAIIGIIRSYAREAGVRNLERELANVCRKVAVAVASGEAAETTNVTGKDLTTYLGPPRMYVEAAERVSTPGVSVGLAWTPTGGDILFIEVIRMRGRGGVTLTGHLGEVMQESARTALSLVRARAEQLGIDPQVFEKEDLHLHVPEGAIPKDGPSAGVAITSALVSAYTQRAVRPDTAMTGEITLRGKVLPVGGIKEKVLAARRAGIKRVVLPDWNRNDVSEIPETHRKGIEILFSKTVDDVLDLVFTEAPATKKSATKKAKASKGAKSSGAKGRSTRKSASSRR